MPRFTFTTNLMFFMIPFCPIDLTGKFWQEAKRRTEKVATWNPLSVLSVTFALENQALALHQPGRRASLAGGVNH